MAQLYDDEHEDWIVKEMTVADYLSFSDTSIPFVDAVPVVHGEWKPCSHYDSNTHMICECSVCGDTVWVYYNSEREWNYCPNCGAKMGGGADNAAY